MSPQDFNKLITIRKLLKEAYDHYFEYTYIHGGHCKSNEGYISLDFGDYYNDKDCKCSITGVTVYSYVLGPHRSHHFDNLDEALSTIKIWHRDEIETVYSEGEYGL